MAGHVGGAPVLEHDLTLPDAFWDSIIMPPDTDLKEKCWAWNGVQWKSGYGRWNQHNWGYWVHRVTYSQYRGPIPDGLTIDHLCMNKICCNPFHLDPVTQKENTRRWAEQKITHCPKGHPYTPDNLVAGSARRRCKICHRQSEYDRRRKMIQTGVKKRPGAVGRPITTTTKLGWMIHQSGLRVYEVQGLAGISNSMLSDYISNRRNIPPHHLQRLCRLFDCYPEDIIGPRTSSLPSGSRAADLGAHRHAGSSDGQVRGGQNPISDQGSRIPGDLREAPADHHSDQQGVDDGEPA